MNIKITLPLLLISCILFTDKLHAQGQNLNGRDTVRSIVIHAVPFLTISPDARAAGMADVGVATTPDANSAYWNAAKLPFIKTDAGFSISYTPWLGKLIDDMNIYNVSGYKRISANEVIAASFKYFDLGNIEFRDINGNSDGDFNPHEFNLDAAYSRKLFENLAVAVGGRFIYSNLTGGYSNGVATAKTGITGAADISVFGRKEGMFNGKPSELAYGLNVSNLGAKITYSDESRRDFIPTNFRIGTAFTTELDPYNKITIAIDANKLMVPSPGQVNNKSLLAGWFGSFADAQGGFKEEMQEIMLGTALEYNYNDVFAARTGYFNETNIKGGRKYFSFGLGLKVSAFTVDFAYIVTRKQTMPLANTVRFTLAFNFGSNKAKE